MRHLKVGKKLGRTSSHRKSTLRSLSASLIKHHRIVTTLVKAKELRRFVEPVITKSKEDTSHHRQQAFAFLQDKEAVTHLFEEVGALVSDRPGGYTRIIKLGPRQGDGAEMAMIELVDYNDVKPEGGKSTRKRTRRGGGGRSRKKSSQKQTEQKKTVTTEEVAEAETDEKAEKKTKAKPAATKKEEEAKAPEPETEASDSAVEEVKEEPKAEVKTEESDSEQETEEKAKDEAVDEKKESDQKDSSDKK